MKRRKEEIGNRKQRGGRRRCGCCMSAGGAAIIVVVCPPGDAVGQLRPALAALETEYGSRKSQQRLSRVPEKVGRCLRCHVNTPAALSNCRFRRERVDVLPFTELLPVRAKRAGIPLFPGGTEKKRDGEEKKKAKKWGARRPARRSTRERERTFGFEARDICTALNAGHEERGVRGEGGCLKRRNKKGQIRRVGGPETGGAEQLRKEKVSNN